MAGSPKNDSRSKSGISYPRVPLSRFHVKLVGGWTNPFEKYARQNGHLPQHRGENSKNIWNHHLGNFGRVSCNVSNVFLGEILVIQSRENLSTLAVNGFASTHLQGPLYVSFRECLCFFSPRFGRWPCFFGQVVCKKPWVVGKTISCLKVWIIFVKNLSGNLFR